MAANRTDVPVLISAAADAPLGGALADLQARPVDENLKHVVGHLRQRTMLVRGQNNRDVWGHNADRVALAITEPLPLPRSINPQLPDAVERTILKSLAKNPDDRFASADDRNAIDRDQFGSIQREFFFKLRSRSIDT